MTFVPFCSSRYVAAKKAAALSAQVFRSRARLTRTSFFLGVLQERKHMELSEQYSRLSANYQEERLRTECVQGAVARDEQRASRAIAYAALPQLFLRPMPHSNATGSCSVWLTRAGQRARRWSASSMRSTTSLSRSRRTLARCRYDGRPAAPRPAVAVPRSAAVLIESLPLLPRFSAKTSCCEKRLSAFARRSTTGSTFSRARTASTRYIGGARQWRLGHTAEASGPLRASLPLTAAAHPLLRWRRPRFRLPCAPKSRTRTPRSSALRRSASARRSSGRR